MVKHAELPISHQSVLIYQMIDCKSYSTYYNAWCFARECAQNNA